ncbi:MAG TPA: hypothetical protein VI997_04180 [Candidatus Thermoplasmatota archaeon]|nr:hypothetical protein [Candidatus Thermoplasmatota archaeon]
MDLAECLSALGKGFERRELSPGVYAFFERRAMHRVRSYTSAALGPFADRQVQDMVLLGHVHVREGRATSIEGFNGQEGIRFAERASAALKAEGLLVEDATVRLETPMRGCPWSVPH